MKAHKLTYLIVSCLMTMICQAQIRDRIDIISTDINLTKAQEFDQINWKSDYFLSKEGEPELPVYRVSYVLPIDAKITGVTFQLQEKRLLKQDAYIYPSQSPRSVGGTGDIAFSQPDKRVYESNEPYPGKLYDIESDNMMLGYHVVTLHIYPFEYIPKSRTLNYYPKLEYTVEYESGKNTEITRPETQSILRADLCKTFIKNLVKNVSDIDKFGSTAKSISQGRDIITQRTIGLRSQNLPILDEIVPEYIIITCDSLKSAFQPLIEWKTKKGIYTIIVSTEEINSNYSGSDLTEKIRNYLLNAHNKWGDGLNILLGGNINIVPSRMVYGVPVSGSDNTKLIYPTDKYYSTETSWILSNNAIFTGSDSQSYMNCLGRILVSNSREIGTITSKMIAYEKACGIDDLSYLNNNLYADAYLESDTLPPYLRNFFHSNIMSHVSSFVPLNIYNRYICDNFNCSGDINKYGSSGSNCNNGNKNGDIELNRDNFLSCLNTGAYFGIGKFHFIYHLDHSNTVSLGTSSKDKGQSISRADADNLSNGTSFQVLFSCGCNPANFAFDCFAKHYLMNQNGGGVTFIGNTDIGYQSEAASQLQYFLNAIYDMGRYDIGNAFLKAISYPNGSRWRLHLLGDPEMQVWTNVPQNLTTKITSPAIITTGQQNVTVSVNGLAADSATICLWKGDEVYETRTVFNGVHSIEVTPETKGTMYVTVTAHNFFPKEDSIIVNQSMNQNPIIQSVNFVDDGSNGSIGNSNGKNDAGETILLQVEIKNDYNPAMSRIQTNNNLTRSDLIVKLSSESNYINVLSSLFRIKPIIFNETAIVQFLYQIDKDAPETLSNDPNPVQFKLFITDSLNTTWTRTFNIDVFATDLQQRNKVNITPYPISANQTVTFNVELQNVGQAPTNGLKAVLTSNNVTGIVSSCSSAEHSYPSIGKFETKTATTPFQFTTGSSYTANTTLNFTLTVTDVYGKTINRTFNLNKQDSVDSLQSFAKVKEIDLKWKTPVSGASGYNIYRCNVDTVTGNELGSYVRLNVTPVTFTFYNDADSLKPLTKYYYKVTAVSQSGMESDSVKILAWTSYPTQGRFPIVMDALTGTFMESNFVAEDVNNDGKKEIFTSLAGSDGKGIGDLVALDWEGNELFNIDNNVTTNSGFANLNTSIRAGVAIGDINQDSVNEIVSVTRSREYGNVNNKIICHIAYDNNGDHMPDMLWQVSELRGYRSGAILDNLDNSADGSMEILTVPDGNTDIIYRAPQIYNAQGTLIQELPIAYDDYTYAAAAVADLYGDGNKEIIAGYYNRSGGAGGLYVWRRDETSYWKKNLSLTLPGYCFASSPVICDINGDGKKEILLSAFSTSSMGSCRILAIATNGNLLPGWGIAPTDSNFYKATEVNDLSKEIAVGDLDGDGKLEVVAVTSTGINIWNNNGTLYKTIPVSGLESNYRSPLLADIDGDSEAEIIVTSGTEGKIYGYKRNGNSVVGFPLEADQAFGNATPVIADLDGDGKSEIAAGTGNDKKIYVWKTNGNPDRIEWGSARHDARNTGEYQKICPPTLIQSDTVWNSSMDICNNLIVEPGAMLTLNSACTLNMNSSSMIIVRPGASLVIDGGKVLNANIKALPESSITLKNNGYIKLRLNGEFNILSGATFDNLQGNIEIQ